MLLLLLAAAAALGAALIASYPNPFTCRPRHKQAGMCQQMFCIIYAV
jgi:hypothetical protein